MLIWIFAVRTCPKVRFLTELQIIIVFYKGIYTLRQGLPRYNLRINRKPSCQCSRCISRTMEKEAFEHMRTIQVQASLRMRTVSPEPVPFTHAGGRLRGNFRQRTSNMALLRNRACALKDCFDGVRRAFFSRLALNTPIQIYWKFYNQKRKIFR